MVLFVIDSLVNGMLNPVYILCAGCLVTAYETEARASREMDYVINDQELLDPG